MIKKFSIPLNKKKERYFYQKVRNFNWNNIPMADAWSMGTDINFLSRLCDYWLKKCSWENEVKKLNKLNQFITKIDGIDIHFIHSKSKNKNALPILLIHGWPGSLFEFKKLTLLLNKTDKNGISFDVVCPSIPGFGFSKPLLNAMGPRKIAKYFNKLMVEVLGYDYYLSQGGDWGAAISSWIGYDYKRSCKGIHLNAMLMRHEKGPITRTEKNWHKKFLQEQQMEDGYRTLQATKPLTLSYAMNDNPVGIAAWIIEKFQSWSDLKGKSLNKIFGYEDLISNIMLYLMTNSFNTSTWIYFGRREEGGRVMKIGKKKIKVPTACALFPKEFLSWPPKSYVNNLYNVVQWNSMPSGGHFAALEEPKLLESDIRKFASKINLNKI
ncbi:MAG: epoxide hydrolase [Phycisphaerae bacterium]|nr:epoxide hydrolase [Phycisphaerae bacterium]